MNDSLKKTIKKLLKYSFKDIGYEYKYLTSTEKELVTEAEFVTLMAWLRRADYKGKLKLD